MNAQPKVVTEFEAFHNRLRCLFNINREDLPSLTDDQWLDFCQDPVGFFLRSDDHLVRIIWTMIEYMHRCAHPVEAAA